MKLTLFSAILAVGIFYKGLEITILSFFDSLLFF